MWSRKFALTIFLIFSFSPPSLWGSNFYPGMIYDLDSKKSFSPFGWEKRETHLIEEENPVSEGLIILFRFYQKILSPIDGPKCPYYPTCSQFGIESVRRYGFFWGLLMLFNRQMREYPNLVKDKWFPLVVKYGVLRVYDPPERAYIWSDFWK